LCADGGRSIGRRAFYAVCAVVEPGCGRFESCEKEYQQVDTPVIPPHLNGNVYLLVTLMLDKKKTHLMKHKLLQVTPRAAFNAPPCIC
jgi:hypothetical protein